jgi:hypothetical protein
MMSTSNTGTGPGGLPDPRWASQEAALRQRQAVVQRGIKPDEMEKD